jgi:hypothetical protein
MFLFHLTCKNLIIGYSDIIQFCFYGAYLNLTSKTLLGFKWATEFCSNAHFIIKTDVNFYVNINRLLRTMLINNRSLKTSVAGICEMGSPRDTNVYIHLPNGLWYIGIYLQYFVQRMYISDVPKAITYPMITTVGVFSRCYM